MAQPHEQQPQSQSAPFELLRIAPNTTQERIPSSDDALQKLLITTKDIPRKEVFEHAAEIIRPKLESRWQLSFKPIIQYANGKMNTHVPSIAEMNANNRYVHSLEAATIGVTLGKACRLSEESLLVLGTALIFHDYMHPVFSHVGEGFMQSAFEFIAQRRPPLYQEMITLGLEGTHEERLIREARDPTSPLGLFLLRRFSQQEQEAIEMIWKEQGAFGQIASLADTVSYLNADSVFAEWQPPHFETILVKELEGFGRWANQELLMLQHGQIIHHILAYRDAMYKLQYYAPINQLIQHLQTSMLWDYFIAVSENASIPEQARILAELINRSDAQMLRFLRKRALIRQLPEGAGVFGVVPDISSLLPVNEDQEDLYTYEKPFPFEVPRIIRKDYPPKTIAFFETATRSVQKASSLLLENPRAFMPLGIVRHPITFWIAIDPILSLLCKESNMNPQAIRTFVETHFFQGIQKSPFSVDSSRLMRIIDRIIETDFSFDYPLPPLLQNA